MHQISKLMLATFWWIFVDISASEKWVIIVRMIIPSNKDREKDVLENWKIKECTLYINTPFLSKYYLLCYWF